jgi:2-methylcitrate dehydratase PrpD
MTVLRHYAEWACHLSYEDLPVVVASNAKKAMIDTIAAMLAGVNEPVSRKILAYVAREKAAGNATVAGSNCRFSAASASLINGAMAHALDYDDLLTSTRSHPSAVLVPAVLAVGETRNASAAEVLVAYLAGLELIDKIGSLAAFAQYAKGWHTTSTLGGMGAAAGAGKLLKLPPAQMRMAVSIAASMAGGLQKNFGTMTKPLHAGLAAQAGVMAALLAADGFTASDDVFAGKDNYLEVTAQIAEPPSIPSFGSPFAVVSPGLHVKRYPCCFATHRALDAVFSIRSEHPQLDVKQIGSITCMAPARSFTALIYDSPATGLEGKFSMQYVVAAAWIDGWVNISSFTDEMVGRKNVRSLMEKVRKVEDPNLSITDPDGTDRRFTEVTIEMTSGPVFQKRVVRPKGSVDVPLTEGELAEKFLECSTGILSGIQQNTALNILRGLESVNSISELMGSLRATN